MNIEQAFVGGVAVALGMLCAAIAVFDLEWFFRLPKARWIEARWGRHGARLVFGALGLLLFLLGVYIALGGRIGFPRGNTPQTAEWRGAQTRRPGFFRASPFVSPLKSVHFSGMKRFGRIE